MVLGVKMAEIFEKNILGLRYVLRWPKRRLEPKCHETGTGIFLILPNKMAQIKIKSHKIALKTYRLLVTFVTPGMDDKVQSKWKLIRATFIIFISLYYFR